MHYEGNNQTNQNERVESLRLILENEQNRSITYAEAQDIADSLISFFEVLAQTEQSDGTSLNTLVVEGQ
jgi:hypothetical protein